MRRWLPIVAAVAGVELLIIAVLLLTVGTRHAEQRAKTEHIRTKETTKIINNLNDRLRQALGESVTAQMLAEILEKLEVEVRQTQMRTIAIQTQTQTPAPATPRPTRRPQKPPGPQPGNPAPAEPVGGDQGTLKPFICAQGLGPALGIDCSPFSPMASTQLMCNAGFDEQFQMDCGPNDKDGRGA